MVKTARTLGMVIASAAVMGGAFLGGSQQASATEVGTTHAVVASHGGHGQGDPNCPPSKGHPQPAPPKGDDCPPPKDQGRDCPPPKGGDNCPPPKGGNC